MKKNYFPAGIQLKNNYNFLKRFAISAMLVLPMLNVYSQTTTTVLQNYDGTNLTTVSPTYTSGVLSVVANPSKVGNTSEYVAQYVRKGSEGYDRLFINVGNSIPKATPYTSNDFQIVFDVYTTAAASEATPIPVRLNLASSATYTTAWPAGLHSEYQSAGITQSNTWQTLTFTFAQSFGDLETRTALNTRIDQLSVMLNGGTGTSDTYYIDNIRIVKKPLNLALGQPAVASSGDALNAANAVDGDLGTRCNNPGVAMNELETNPPFVYVDLGSSYDINHVAAIWEGAYAHTYDMLISDDASFPTDKTTVMTFINGPGRHPAGPFPMKNDFGDGLAVLGSGRYVKIVEKIPGTVWGFGLWELQVFGTPVAQTQLGIDSVTGEETPVITLHPNPASDYVKLSFPENLNNKVISIYDLSGKQVLQTKLDDAAAENVVNINQLSKGTYILNIKSDGKSWSKKLIKE